MCGRFGMAADIEGVLDYFRFDPSSVRYKQRYNVAPTDPVLTYGAQGPRTAEYMRWGLIPSWSKPGGRKLPLAINARAEGIATQPMFKRPFQHRRCLVLSDGFYEWARPDAGAGGGAGAVTPYRIGLASWGVFGFAGLWDEWAGPDGTVRSCTIITTTPNELVAPIHDRMPVILPPEAHEEWLDADNHDTEALGRLLVPYPSGAMAAYEVGKAVGDVKNDTPVVMEPVRRLL